MPPRTTEDECGRRPDLSNDFTAAQRAQLATLITTYVTAEIITEHELEGQHGNSQFIPWHRDYLAGLEAFLIGQGHPEFVPLPKWNPANPIPPEFCIVDPDCPGQCGPLQDLDLAFPLPSHLRLPNLCDFKSLEELRLGEEGSFILCNGLSDGKFGLEDWHGCVHCNIGGTMCAIAFSPAAIIFWPWHAFVDDVAYCWQCECNTGPECDTITLPPPPSGDCIEQLRGIIAEVPRHYRYENRPLLVTLERAEAELRAGDVASAELTLRVLLREATALTLNGRYTRFPYEAVAMQTRVCLEGLGSRD